MEITCKGKGLVGGGGVCVCMCAWGWGKFCTSRIAPAEKGGNIFTLEIRIDSLRSTVVRLKVNQYIFMGGNSVKIVCCRFEKESTLKGKNLLPVGANSFLLD